MSELFPWEFAAADQGLARFSCVLSELTDRLRALQVGFQLMDFDWCSQISSFMVGDVAPRFDETGALAALAIVVDRIVKLEDRLAAK